MDYPLYLLPKESYKTIQCDLSDFYLIRHFELINSELPILDANGEIEDKFLFNPSERLGDLSTSLLSVFTEKDICIALTKEGGKEFGMYCNDSFDSEVPRYEDHFYFDKSREFWHVKIGDINNQKLKYKHTDGDKEKEFFCRVMNTPAKWNFWHFSIRWEFEDGAYFFELHKEGKVTKGNIKRISSCVRFLLKKKAKVGKVNFPILPEIEYIK